MRLLTLALAALSLTSCVTAPDGTKKLAFPVTIAYTADVAGHAITFAHLSGKGVVLTATKLKPLSQK